jgi:DNA-binding HxlR family transcriptional regulator
MFANVNRARAKRQQQIVNNLESLELSAWTDKPYPIARSLDVLGDAWTVVILRELFVGNTDFA